MGRIIKCIKFILLQISTIFIRYKWQSICALVSGVIMYITTFLRNTDIVYSIPIIIFVIGAIPWTILGCIKLYEFITNREELEIIYDSGKYNKKTKIFNQNRECDETIFMYIFSIKNISKNKTAESIFVIIDGLDTVSHKLQYTNDSYNRSLSKLDI
jgi:hypothetical protein